MKARHILKRYCLLGTAILLLIALAPLPAVADDVKGLLATLQTNSKLDAKDDILAGFAKGESETAVLVILQPSDTAKALAALSQKTDQVPGAFTVAGAPTYYNLQDESIKAQLLATVAETVTRVIDQLGVTGMTVTRRFPYEFGFAAKATPEALARILDSPDVLLVKMDALGSGRYFSSSAERLSDGQEVERIYINGPPAPPPGYDVERQAVSLPDRLAGVNTLTVPAFDWVFGCSAVSGAMIAGYYDRSGFPDMYTGPTNGGVMPLNNSSWPTWSDGYVTYPNCPLIASRNGVDGRTTRGSIDDYWIKYDSTASDPYITNGWSQHAWGDAIGDFMKTSQSAYGNGDGSTRFWNYISSASRLTCDELASNSLPDGTLGRKLFYEAKGYTVTDCYNQKTDNAIAGGFSFANFKAEIDAGRPVLLNLEGHSIVGVGYDDSSNLVYIHDTWDHSNHTMTWGTSYSGMALLSVSVVNLANTSPAVTSTVPGPGATDVSQASTIKAVFSKAMNPATINATTFTLTSGVPVSGNPPEKAASQIANLATSAPLAGSVSATASYDAASRKATLTPSPLQVGSVSGTVSYDAVTRTATFKPSAPLAPNTNYTATITTGATDSSGTHMSTPFTWSFSTTLTCVGSEFGSVTLVNVVPAPGTVLKRGATVNFSGQARYALKNAAAGTLWATLLPGPPNPGSTPLITIKSLQVVPSTGTTVSFSGNAVIDRADLPELDSMAVDVFLMPGGYSCTSISTQSKPYPVVVPPSFTLTASPTPASVAQGGKGASTITSTVANGFSSAVFLSASGLPNGVTATFSPASIAAPGAGSSAITLTAGPTAAVGNYTATVTGTGGGVTRSAKIAFTVTPSYTLSGTVHVGSATGTVLAGATVSIAGKTATTSSTGTFSITAIPAGRYTLTISKAGCSTYIGNAYDMTAHKTGTNFFITQYLSLSGTVRSGSATGTAVAGATVSIAGKTATAGSTGSFTVIGIPPGTYSVLIFKQGYQISTVLDYTMTSSRAGVIFALSPAPTYSLSGTVRTVGNTGVAGATVSIAGKSVTTGSTGTFTMTGIPAGKYVVYVSKAGYTTYTNPAYAVANDIAGEIFNIAPIYYLSGTVRTDSNTGPLLAGATVSIAGMTTTTSSTGAFSITGIPAGTYPLTVSKPGCGTYIDPAYAVNANKAGQVFYVPTVAKVALQLSPNPALSPNGNWNYVAALSETNGIGVTVSFFTWDFYDETGNYLNTQINTAEDFASWFGGSSRLQALGVKLAGLYTWLGGRLSGSVVLTFYGTDDNNVPVSVSATEYLNYSEAAAPINVRLDRTSPTPRVWKAL